MISRHSRSWLMFVGCFGICLLTFLSSLAFPAQALAASDPITITTQSNTISFPKGMDFYMKATDLSSTITEATITLNIESGEEEHTIKISPPMRNISVHWHEKITGENFAPVGTPVSYYWTIEDSLGLVHIAQKQSFQVTDTRFTWQQVAQGNLRINWYAQPQSFGQEVLQQSSIYLKRISANLGGSLRKPINLWIYHTVEDFQSGLPPGTQEWVGGVAFPTLQQASLVIEDLDSDTLERDMPHEMTHLIFHQLVSRSMYIPTWFDEGIAVYNQPYHEPMMTLQLKKALEKQRLLRLNEIEFQFPEDSDKAYLAYAQSWNLVEYMYNTFGQKRMASLIKNMDDPRNSFDEDLALSIGIDQDHLENNWRLSLKQPPTLEEKPKIPTIQPIPTPVPVKTTSDNSTPLLLILGITLIIVPLFALGGVFAYQRQGQRKTPAFKQGKAGIHPSLPPYYPPRASYPHPNGVPHTPPIQWDKQVIHLPPTRKYIAQYPNQEYINNYPDRQQPQE
jgi:hypothetical protein